MSFDTVEVAGSSPVVATIFFSGLEPLPHLSSPGFNLFWSFFNLTPALKPPVEDNGRMLPTPGVRGFYWRQNPDLSIRVEIDRVGGYKIRCAD